MAVEIVMPRLSDSMEEGTILRWLVAPGDEVTSGQPLAEIETDKATVTHEALEGGVILALSAAEGATVAVGATIATIATVIPMIATKPTPNASNVRALPPSRPPVSARSW